MMNSSILRCSLVGTQSSALKEPEAVSPRGTCAAIFAGRSETSKFWMARTPDCPSSSLRHVTSTPHPSGVTIPRPVTTTRLMPIEIRAADGGGAPASPSAMRLDEVDGVLHGYDLLGSVVRDLAAELLLECHHELDSVEAVRPEVVDEAR